MRTVYQAHTLIDAHLVKDALEAAGIPAFISGEYLTGGVGQLPALGFIAVMVPEVAIPEASPVVARIEAQLAEAGQALHEQDDDGLWQPAS